ncbi:hypothetical protein [Palleronia sp. LCG004]|uniref:hypothetical protein n=1 Tax=Palleronia sp. LCG004 TaxID=3079304 RepID=UPI002942F085|nr:hypothetical protein [Palleronia sp. LCG004]WOI58097.1 hypothetical protein RVY76_16375 [Palleronia sp. LCG004]
MTHISIIVTLEDRARLQSRQIGDELGRHGVVVESEMPELGLIFGRCAPDRLADVAGIEGVAEARPEGRVDLPPVDDDTPQ